MDKTAIQQIQDTAAAVALARDVLDHSNALAESRPVIALPENFELHNLEQYLPGRTRYRARFTTAHIKSFADYHEKQGMEAPVFIDRDKMRAQAVFNLGDSASPGHGDDTATLALDKTAAFRAFENLAGAHKLNQREIAEWVEDWRARIQAVDGEGKEIPISKLVRTLRNIDIKAARDVNSSEGDFSSRRSAMESVEANSTEGAMPKVISFTCEPYHGLGEQEFRFRISLLTGGDTLAFSVHRIQEEADTEVTADHFCQVLKNHLAGNAVIYQGSIAL